MSTLNLFPARIRFTNPDGTLTPEAVRVLNVLVERAGGVDGMGAGDLALLAAFVGTPEADSGANDLLTLSAFATPPAKASADVIDDVAPVADLAELRKYAQALEIRYLFEPTFVVPWDRPGQIGLRTRNTGAFSQLGVDDGTELLPSFQLGTDPATGFYRIGANNWGFSVSGFKLVDFAATAVGIVGSLSATGQLKSAVATGTAPLQVTSTTKVANLNVDKLQDKDWATPGSIGTTTPAAGKFTSLQSGPAGFNGQSARTPDSLGAAATDPASTQALANTMRTVLIAWGIGS